MPGDCNLQGNGMSQVIRGYEVRPLVADTMKAMLGTQLSLL